MVKPPSLISAIHTEYPVFLLAYLPALLAIASIVTLLQMYFPYEDLTKENILMLVFTPLLSIVGFPFILWWWYMIRRTFIRGIVTSARVTKTTDSVLYLHIHYSFLIGEKEHNHLANFLKNEKTKKIVCSKNVSVVYDSSKNLSFLVDAY
jgi:hypothetical protein